MIHAPVQPPCVIPNGTDQPEARKSPKSTIFTAVLATGSLKHLVLPGALISKQQHHLYTWPAQGQTQVLQGSLRSKTQWTTHMQR